LREREIKRRDRDWERGGKRGSKREGERERGKGRMGKTRLWRSDVPTPHRLEKTLIWKKNTTALLSLPIIVVVSWRTQKIRVFFSVVVVVVVKLLLLLLLWRQLLVLMPEKSKISVQEFVQWNEKKHTSMS
jgi:hypothetical protein